MSVSIDSWNDFMFKVGQDFYDFLHGDGYGEDDAVSYPVTLNYKGVGCMKYRTGTDYRVPFLCDVNLQTGVQDVISNVELLYSSNITDSSLTYENFQTIQFDYKLSCLNSFNSAPFFIGSDNKIMKKGANGSWYSNILNQEYSCFYFNYLMYNKSSIPTYFTVNTKYCWITSNSTWDYYIDSSDGRLPYYVDNNANLSVTLPYILKSSPLIINSTEIDINNNITTTIQNIYKDSSSTVNNYTYNIDNDNYINVTYTTDSDGVPNGYIDINPTGNFSFDDLFDMFNTILAPLVGVGLDLPDWTDYEPEYPIVTGDINVNIDIPDVTGEYPAETITPIDSDVYNIMSIDSMPQLPSLTGIDNGETAGALGSSFTFLDGCGLLMPFVMIAIIRLLISKFRGDS